MVRKRRPAKGRDLLFALLLTLISCAVSSNKNIDVGEARGRVARGALLVDVRTPQEFQTGHVPGARNIPHTDVESRLAEFGGDKKHEIVLYCGSGRRAGLAQQLLQANGYTNVFNAGAYSAWNSAHIAP